MLNKILLALGIVVVFSTLGNTLQCQRCSYRSDSPKASQKCNPNSTVNCSALGGADYCFTVRYTQSDGIDVVLRDCDLSVYNYCPDAQKSCDEQTKKNNLKACAGACCNTDGCNNFTPSSASGIVVAKITLIQMVIAGVFAS